MGLCDNRLTRGHVARNCPKQSFCKIQECKEKHSTYLPESTKSKNDDTNQLSPAESTWETEPGYEAQTGYVKSTENSKDERKLKCPVIGLSFVPIKVKAVGSNRMVETYAFLDSGSNTSFCSKDLMIRLDKKGKSTTLSLTTTTKTNSKPESSVACEFRIVEFERRTYCCSRNRILYDKFTSNG